MYNTKVLIDAYITYARDVAVALGADPQLAYSDMYEMVRLEREISKVILFLELSKLLQCRVIIIISSSSNSYD